MQADNKISTHKPRKPLKDFIRLVFAFFLSLTILALYQQLRLYSSGVLDSFINKSFFILILHHIGFTALLALFLAFGFNFLENKKAGRGFNIISGALLLLLLIEALLTEYYVQRYEILSAYTLAGANLNAFYVLLTLALALLLIAPLFYFFHKITAAAYNLISKMYPFTIILFSLFLATLNSNRRPINENKTQHLITSIVDDVFDFNKYEGKAEYPFLKAFEPNDSLGELLQLKTEKPDIVVLVIDGLGAQFLGKKATYKGFTPFMDSLMQESLYWSNFVGNTGESTASIPTILGSLPFGKNGFTELDKLPNRHTLFGLLKNNGYSTAFNYGGNSSLGHLDKFLNEERVDQVLDRKGFGPHFKIQEEDAAGISLGYPDMELFRKWQNLPGLDQGPKLEVFLTQSTKRPFLIPNQKSYIKKVEDITSKARLTKRSLKLIDRNKEIFASVLYADESIKSFLGSYKKRPRFKNTIFVITGSHSLNDLPHDNELGRYRVPLLVYSPLVKSPKQIYTLASHLDIMPSVIALLHQKYRLKLPSKVSWLGTGLTNNPIFEPKKEIPLFRGKNNIRDYIQGSYFLSSGKLFTLNKQLELLETDDNVPTEEIKKNFKYFKGANKYATTNNKIIPKALSSFTKLDDSFSKQEMIWINSVFNGEDFDNAYKTARSLALDNDPDRALLLCRYVLSKIPGHADTEVLMGRVHAWQGNYGEAITILKETVRKYPMYSDCYSALLDVYFWSDKHSQALVLYDLIRRNGMDNRDIKNKMDRVYLKLGKDAPFNKIDSGENQKTATLLESDL
ncbi:sulfatase-like hydrolase/transferase [Spongiimicrobium sp. 3-5]|uniref:sulfatase-like hydrolase/transferase n=1 Tax=Spongiimicrobium sp. 3-5 TaxID=3332596 RepID=UPI003980C767